MKKEEIIKLLDKEVGLFNELEDEDKNGDLYVTEIQFKEIEIVLDELKGLRKWQVTWNNRLREIVEGDERFIVWKGEKMLKDKVINVPLPIICIDGKNIITHCIFNDKNKEV